MQSRQHVRWRCGEPASGQGATATRVAAHATAPPLPPSRRQEQSILWRAIAETIGAASARSANASAGDPLDSEQTAPGDSVVAWLQAVQARLNNTFTTTEEEASAKGAAPVGRNCAPAVGQSI